MSVRLDIESGVSLWLSQLTLVELSSMSIRQAYTRWILYFCVIKKSPKPIIRVLATFISSMYEIEYLL
jgi:hypothetical protein